VCVVWIWDTGSTLLQNMYVVSAGKISLVSARQVDTIYMIQKGGLFSIGYCQLISKIIISIGWLMSADTKNQFSKIKKTLKSRFRLVRPRSEPTVVRLPLVDATAGLCRDVEAVATGRRRRWPSP
jgi:hypothetical protein